MTTNFIQLDTANMVASYLQAVTRSMPVPFTGTKVYRLDDAAYVVSTDGLCMLRYTYRDKGTRYAMLWKGELFQFSEHYFTRYAERIGLAYRDVLEVVSHWLDRLTGFEIRHYPNFQHRGDTVVMLAPFGVAKGTRTWNGYVFSTAIPVEARDQPRRYWLAWDKLYGKGQ